MIVAVLVPKSLWIKSKLCQSLCLWILAQGFTTFWGGKSHAHASTSNKNHPIELQSSESINRQFLKLADRYLKGRIRHKNLWERLTKIVNTGQLNPVSKIHALQIQADLLYRADLKIISAIYAADALKLAEDPLHQRFDLAWSILRKVSLAEPIQYIFDDLALTLELNDRQPREFGNDWNYIFANALSQRGREQQASAYYGRINMGSRYFMPARYQIAMIAYERGDYQDAMGALKSILMPSTRDVSPLAAKDQLELWNNANMAIGRIKYETREFLESARYFRRVTKTSPLYYDSLFEQSWSLFMSGNPNHALGSLYGSDSPFFADVDNPEVKVLESIIYFWMCRYADARNSLADFVESYAKTMTALNNILESQKLTVQDSYDLFENLVAGVSGDSLGIPRKVLGAAARRDTMLLLRDQLASVMVELDQLQKRGIHGARKQISDPLSRMAALRQSLKMQLGQQFLQEIAAEKTRYADLHRQAEFLYLELLMSEKEQLLGRELHAELKVNKSLAADNIRGWGRNTQAWKGGNKGEFWWDEIGFHIVEAKPMCVEN